MAGNAKASSDKQAISLVAVRYTYGFLLGGRRRRAEPGQGTGQERNLTSDHAEAGGRLPCQGRRLARARAEARCAISLTPSRPCWQSCGGMSDGAPREERSPIADRASTGPMAQGGAQPD